MVEPPTVSAQTKGRRDICYPCKPSRLIQQLSKFKPHLHKKLYAHELRV
jgi:hypothetical protein